MNYKQILASTLLLFTIIGYSQLKKEKEDYYLEDQIYIKFAYNLLNKLPEHINQSGFSNSLSIGFIKDIPTNKERNFGFGIGIGYGINTYFHNLKITKVNNEILFENFQIDEYYKNNKLIIHNIEIPIEIRWRTSTREKYKFWRIYGGIKTNYIFNSKASYKLNGTQEVTNIKEIKKLQHGLSLAAGYGNINFYIYYSLTPVFKDAYYNNDTKIKTKDIKIGIQFYIL